MRYVHSEKIGKPNNLQTLRSRTSKPNGLNMIAKVTDAWGRLTLHYKSGHYHKEFLVYCTLTRWDMPVKDRVRRYHFTACRQMDSALIDALYLRVNLKKVISCSIIGCNN